jgi:hypothetical protein
VIVPAQRALEDAELKQFRAGSRFADQGLGRMGPKFEPEFPGVLDLHPERERFEGIDLGFDPPAVVEAGDQLFVPAPEVAPKRLPERVPEYA